MKITTRILSVLAFALVVGAAGSAHAFEEIVTPVNVGCFTSGECFMVISPALSATNTTCSDRTQVRFQMSSSGAESVFKTILSAQLSGKKIKVNPAGIAGPNVPCVGAYPGVGYLFLVN